MLHLLSCRSTDTRATDSEMRELARVLERGGTGSFDAAPWNVEFSVSSGTGNALICTEALRRCAGKQNG